MIGLWLPSYLTWFSVGMLIAACFVHVHREADDAAVGSTRVASALRQMGLTPGVCWTAGLALFAIAATPVAGPASLTAPTLGEAMTKNLLYAVTAGLLILPAVFADPGGRFIRVMSTPFLRHLGHISYGVFCVHLVILELVARWRDIELFEGRTVELFATDPRDQPCGLRGSLPAGRTSRDAPEEPRHATSASARPTASTPNAAATRS